MYPIRIEIETNKRGRVLASVKIGRSGRRGPEIALDESAVQAVASILLPHATGDEAKSALEAIVGVTSPVVPEVPVEPDAVPTADEQLDALAGGRTRRKKKDDDAE